MLIKNITLADVDQLMKIHNRTFTKDHFSSYFPENLLREYLSQLLGVNEYNIAAFHNSGEMIGFLIAGNKSKEVLKRFTAKNFSIIFFQIIRHPYFLYEKTIEIVLKMLHIKSNSSEKLRLYLIEIDHEYQGAGVGKKLLDFFEDMLKSKNIFSYGLSVRKNNLQAIRFYEKNNFQREFVNLKSVYFVKELTTKHK